MKDTTGRGELSELEILMALTRAGYKILRPLSARLRYDLAIDNGDGTVARVQCKTGIMKNGFIEFRTCIRDARRPGGVPYHGQIEAFGVFCPGNGRAYLVPISAVTTSSTARLRLTLARNEQSRSVRHAGVFEIRSGEPG